MQEEDCRINQPGQNHKGDPILELERELCRLVPEQQHGQKTTRPTTEGTNGYQVELIYPITPRITGPELVPGEWRERRGSNLVRAVLQSPVTPDECSQFGT